MEPLLVKALSDIGIGTQKLAEYFILLTALKFYIDKRISDHKSCCTKVDPLLFNVSIKSVQDTLNNMQESINILIGRGGPK